MSGAIEVVIDPDLADLIPGFLENRKGDVTKIGELVAAGDAEGLRKVGHDLKGCGVAYGFDPISDIGARLEKCGLENRVGDAVPLRDELQAYLSRVVVTYA